MDAVTNYYTLAGLKQYTYIFLKFWRPEVQNQVQYTEIKCEWGLPLSGSTRGEAVPCFWRLPVAATLPWLENTRLRCSIVTSGLYSQISLLSLRRTLMTAFRAHLDNPGLYPHHPPLFFFFIFAICSSIHKLPGFGHGCLWEDHYSVYHTLCEKK